MQELLAARHLGAEFFMLYLKSFEDSFSIRIPLQHHYPKCQVNVCVIYLYCCCFHLLAHIVLTCKRKLSVLVSQSKMDTPSEDRAVVMLRS